MTNGRWIATTSSMKLPIKMYLLIFICASVIFYQYNLFQVWATYQERAPAASDLNDTGQEARDYGVEDPSDPTDPSPSRIQAALIAHNLTVTIGPSLPPLYIITPTYRRPEQFAELTRLSHTLRLVKNIHWLLIEDAVSRAKHVTTLLQKSGIRYQHMTAPMPEKFKRKRKGPKPRGVSNRNKGLQWIRENARDGVLYFADDDNTYDLEIFDQIRYTKKVSMFPVGLVTKLGVSSPIVRDGHFAGFYDGWMAGRKFPVDMAGFAVSVRFLLSRPAAAMPYQPGFEEDGFLKSLKPFEPREVELFASNCTKILVWHTQTKKNEPSLSVDSNKYNNTNIMALKQLLV